jgi:maltose/moltooligosaccharide transporter
MKSPLSRLHAWWKKINVEAAGPLRGRYSCGTLHYTPAGLAFLFAWLLWGDFTFTLMESMPSLLNMQLKDHGVDNRTIAILTTTLFQVCNMALNPVISTYSDRYRSPWGRRRPLLMFATPFVAVFLTLIPWAPEVTAALQKIGIVRALFDQLPFAPLVLIFGILIFSFQVFNMFISTIYYYLIPDTVPEAFIGRFLGYFRIFGILAGILFNWFIFGHAREHMRLLFAVFSILYAISFIMMCWRVREGEYPEIREEKGHWFSPVRNYVVQCFGKLRHWLIFLAYGSIIWASATSVFVLFFYRDQIGLTETEFGRLMTATLLSNLLLSVPFGSLIDRLGSHKSLIIGLSFGILFSLICFSVIQDRSTAFVFGFLLSIPGSLISLAMFKWTVDMYPRETYGQFASAGAMVGALGLALLSPLAGVVIDKLGNYYRLCLIVPAVCYGLSLIFCIALHNWPSGDHAGDSPSPAEAS